MSWTDDRVELLKKLWQDGLSASQIAGELGGVTRNAVIGKVHRLGLSGRGQPTSSIKRTRRPRAASAPRRPRRITSIGSAALKLDIDAAPEHYIQPREVIVIPIAKRLSIEKLTDKTCKWPIGDPTHEDFHFCGHDSDEGTPYCKYHSSIAYQAPDHRRRARRAAG